MNIYQYLSNNPKINKVINNDSLKINKTNFNLNLLLILVDYKMNEDTIFVVLPTIQEAQKYYENLIEYVSFDDVLFFPADELLTSEMLTSSNDFLFERIETITSLLKNEHKIVVTNTTGILKKEVNKNIFKSHILELKKGDVIKREELVKELLIMGYTKNYLTMKTGEFSRRGEILDIFLFGYDKPIRIDFFDDEIESIKFYDTTTQRSLALVDKINIYPIKEFLYDDETLSKALAKINLFIENNELSTLELDTINKDIENLKERNNLERLSRYLYFFYEDYNNILDYSNNKKIYFIDAKKIEDVKTTMFLDLNEYCNRLGGYSILKMEPFYNLDNITNKIMIEGLRTIGDVDLSFNVSEVTNYQGKEKAIIADLKRLQQLRKVILSVTNEFIPKLKNSLFDNDVFYNEGTVYEPKDNSNIFITNDKLPSIIFNDYDIYIINEHNLLDVEVKKKTPRYKSIYKNASKINRYDELEIGDYIVHYDYGIGRYLGLKTLKNNGINRDYIYVEYKNKSSLYIPIEKISSIMKYASKDIDGINLHEIGSSEWARTKEKVRKKIKDISDRLIKLYATREKAKGFSFPKDSPEQALFEADFDYELTDGQKEAVEMVKKDMESPHPMDRLICGDVGYGKTEVALRAAFKAVYGGKQVALLCPTTILSNQHYNTFKARMEKYAIRVEVLNRFVSAKKVKEILNDLSNGSIDIIIGTHRILSSDIKFYNLGLLIVDEEQRFGVIHKERIKELKVNVDSITLSATPIPRTLQMSILGIKDLSMIETPPKNRYPIQTYVLERNDSIIHDAITRELARGGQVFYLYNYVEDIEEVASHISNLVPEAKVVFAHGRLKSNELEKRVYDFAQGIYNVLICTTIIETGIDIPETNTLIIHDADHLGLSQLYQIRGRIGRTNKIAYAYLFYEPHKRLTIEAEKRLEVIKEFSELGSGFKIAMRDLSIRGAGDILGAEQSGFIDSVGLDMYLKIMNEEINHLPPVKEETSKIEATPLLSLSINKDYIENESVRIDIHRKIEKLNSLSMLMDLTNELKDRFGQIDKETTNYMWEKLFKNMITKFGFDDIYEENNTLVIKMNKEETAKIDGSLWFLTLKKYPYLSLRYKSPYLELVSKNNKVKIKTFKDVVNYLSEIAVTTRK